MKKFNWKLIPLNLFPGLLILLSFAVSKATISNNLSLPDIFNLLGMLLCFAAPITVGVLNLMKCTKVIHFNKLQLILLVATIGANELHTKL